MMSPADAIKALLTAQRAFERAARARTCGEANNNLRLGQKWAAVGSTAVRRKYASKIPPKMWAPEWKEAAAIEGTLANYESTAHLHRLDKCDISMLQHERQAAEARIDKTDSARERHYRKRPKKRTIGRTRRRR